MLEIKRLLSSRWKECRDIRLDALMKNPIAFGSSFEEENKLSQTEWKKRTKNALFAFLNNKVVGIVILVFLKQQKLKHIANIAGVYVKKEYRSQGIGKKLIEEALDEIKRNKQIIKINLNVNPDQKAAVNLYKKLGFKPIGVLKKDLFVKGKFYDELMMEKHIS